ncbi:MAG: heme A synthase [Bacteroidia bacterium]|nr:MAG: heme A synthase [Bacteroidia bacterium]
MFSLFKQNPYKPFVIWLLTGAVLIYVMVVVGSITRLTHSGLSITDWSVMGSLPPMSEESWIEHFSKYQESPEYKIKNFGMSLEEFRSIFWWEYIHRFIGRLIGVVFIVGFIVLHFKKQIPEGYNMKVLVLFFLGALQGVIGWWMVKSGLVDKPAVSHYRLAIHLLNAFLVFGFTFWYLLDVLYYKHRFQTSRDEKRYLFWVIVFFIVLIAQIKYGAFVAGLKAGLFYNTWPKMGTEWFPSDTILIYDNFLRNFLDVPAGVQFVHRTLGILVVLLTIWLWHLSSKYQLKANQQRTISWVIYFVTIQFMLGIFTLLYQVPIFLGVLHQTVAFFLYATTIYLIFLLTRKNTLSE